MPPLARIAACVALVTCVAASAGAGSVNFYVAPDRTGSAAERRVADDPPPAALAPTSSECRRLQREVASKQKVILAHERSVEANQRWADDIDRSAISRRRYELRAEEEARWLARAEADLERFVDAQRRKGVLPGCLR